jgi:hypothetical protein
MRMTKREIFITEVSKAVRLDAGVFTLGAIDNITQHIEEHQYIEFIERLSNGKEFARPLEIIKSVSDSFLEEKKSLLFADVEANAKVLEKKLEKFFTETENIISPTSKIYNKKYHDEYKTPLELMELGQKSLKMILTKQEGYIVNKIDLKALYEAFCNPYKVLEEIISDEMKRAITQKHLTKEVRPKLSGVDMKRIGK